MYGRGQVTVRGRHDVSDAGAEQSAPLAPAESYSVLLVAWAARDVVPSAAVRRALRPLGAPAGGIAAGGTVFTAEALALLAEHGAQVVAPRPPDRRACARERRR